MKYIYIYIKYIIFLYKNEIKTSSWLIVLNLRYTHIITREASSHDTCHVQGISRGIRIITTKRFFFVPVTEIKNNKNINII